MDKVICKHCMYGTIEVVHYDQPQYWTVWGYQYPSHIEDCPCCGGYNYYNCLNCREEVKNFKRSNKVESDRKEN